MNYPNLFHHFPALPDKFWQIFCTSEQNTPSILPHSLFGSPVITRLTASEQKSPHTSLFVTPWHPYSYIVSTSRNKLPPHSFNHPPFPPNSHIILHQSYTSKLPAHSYTILSALADHFLNPPLPNYPLTPTPCNYLGSPILI